LEQNLPKGCTYERAIRELAYDELQEGAQAWDSVKRSVGAGQSGSGVKAQRWQRERWRATAAVICKCE
jgi:hypothetical protein